MPMSWILDGIARDEPLIWRWVSSEQNKNFERALGMVDVLMVRGSEARVAAVLAKLGGRLGIDADAPRVLDITQTRLAAVANVSLSALSAVLKLPLVVQERGIYKTRPDA
jgi:CRP-like cAMP-binding protein